MQSDNLRGVRHMREEYPRMLYKVGATEKEAEGFVLGHSNIGYKTVKSYDEEKTVKALGWMTQYQESLELAESKQVNKAQIDYVKKHFKFIFSTLLAIIGLIIAYLSLVKI